MPTVTIKFPSIEMANLFASTFPDGQFSEFINKFAEKEEGYEERLESYIEPFYDHFQRGDHHIDLTESLLEEEEDLE